MRGLKLVVLAAALMGGGCRDSDEVPGYGALARQVERGKVGADTDHWIEMKNMSSEWERTGLIFGYLGDYDECLKAVAGLKQANPDREYRCTPAN